MEEPAHALFIDFIESGAFIWSSTVEKPKAYANATVATEPIEVSVYKTNINALSATLRDETQSTKVQEVLKRWRTGDLETRLLTKKLVDAGIPLDVAYEVTNRLRRACQPV